MRSTQDIAAGLSVAALAGAILFGLSRIPRTAYQAIAPDLFPRVCAYALLAGGAILIARGMLKNGARLSLPALRPLVTIVIAVVAFGFLTPLVGYAIAGLLTVIIGGLANRETPFLHLLVFAVILIAFSVVLFSVVLKLTIPILILPGFRI